MPPRNPETDKLVAPPDFKGPTEDRHCTDVLCFVLLLVTWTAMTFLGLYAIGNGDHRMVLYPLDYDGNICGLHHDGADMTNFPNLYYVNRFAGVCVDRCPDLTGVTLDDLTDMHTLITYNGTFQRESAGIKNVSQVIQVGNYSRSPNARSCTEERCYPDNNDIATSWYSEGIRQGTGYAYYLADTVDILNRCYVTRPAAEEIGMRVGEDVRLFTGRIDNLQDIFTELYADVWAARKYVLGFGFGASFGISLFYIFLMRLPVLLNVMVWGSILATLAMFFVAGYFAQQAIPKLEEDPSIEDHTVNMTKATAGIAYTIGILLTLFTICMRKAIQMSISCVKEAGRAINAMPLILTVPVIQAVAFLIFLSVFMVYGVFLASLGEINTTEVDIDVGENVLDQEWPTIQYRTYNFSDEIEAAGWFLIFCFFWTSNFITAYGDMTVSMSVAKWYFTRDKSWVGSWTVFTSLFHTGFYHAGTCAYGALILAFIQLIRTIIAKFQKYAKDTGNSLAQYVLCMCQCCFWCLEKCIKFLNKNAYIQTAIFSTSFCTSAKESFFLVLRNAARFSAVTYVSAAVLIIGKLFIGVVTTSIGYYLLQENREELNLNSIWGPTVLIFLIAYWISDFFMGVFDMGISTMLHCLIADEEMFDGDQQYAQKSLQRYVDKFGSDDDTARTGQSSSRR